MGAKQTIKRTTTVKFNKTKEASKGPHRCPTCGKYMKGRTSGKSSKG